MNQTLKISGRTVWLTIDKSLAEYLPGESGGRIVPYEEAVELLESSKNRYAATVADMIEPPKAQVAMYKKRHLDKWKHQHDKDWQEESAQMAEDVD